MDKQQELNYKHVIMDEIDRCRSLANDLTVRLKQLEIDVDALFQIERSITPGSD